MFSAFIHMCVYHKRVLKIVVGGSIKTINFKAQIIHLLSGLSQNQDAATMPDSFCFLFI